MLACLGINGYGPNCCFVCASNAEFLPGKEKIVCLWLIASDFVWQHVLMNSGLVAEQNQTPYIQTFNLVKWNGRAYGNSFLFV